MQCGKVPCPGTEAVENPSIMPGEKCPECAAAAAKAKNKRKSYMMDDRRTKYELMFMQVPRADGLRLINAEWHIGRVEGTTELLSVAVRFC